MYTFYNIGKEMIEDITLILRDWLKVIKVVSMYPEDNPLPQSLKRSFAEKLAEIIDEYGDISIVVQKDSLLFDNQVVFRDSSKEESLAGIFFQTGITKFVFKRGLDVDEIYDLLDIFKEYLNSSQKNKDLVAMIWEVGFEHFGFNTVEDVILSEYSGNIDLDNFADIDSSDESRISSKAIFGKGSTENYGAIFETASESSHIELDDLDELPNVSGKLPGVSSPGQKGYSTSGVGPSFSTPRSLAYEVIGLEDDGDSSLNLSEAIDAMGFAPSSAPRVPEPASSTVVLQNEIDLSKREDEMIAELLEADSQFDMYESTSELLKEMLHQEIELPGFNETVTICEKIMTEFIAAGQVLDAGLLLNYLLELKEKIKKSKPLWAERLKETEIAASSKEKLTILVEALNEDREIGAGIIKQYLDNFGWEALRGVSSMLEKLKFETHKASFCDFLALKGRNNLNIIANGLTDKNSDTVISSIIVLSRIGDDESIRLLMKVADHRDYPVRETLVMSLRETNNENAIPLLVKLARDDDETIRRESVRSISSRKGQQALEAIAEIINDDNFDKIESQDQQQLLNAFSILGGDKAVRYLCELILKYNIFDDDLLTFYRSAAFESLSLNRGEKAEKMLLKLTGNIRPDIKKQARTALYKRRALIYGGE